MGRMMQPGAPRIEPAAGTVTGPAATPASSRTFRVCLWLHRWCGLISAPFFLVLCITGSILVFHAELQTLMGDVPAISDFDPSAPLPAAKMVEQARAISPDLAPLYVLIDSHRPEIAMVGMAPLSDMSTANARPLYFHASSGQFLNARDLLNDTFVGWVFDLHAQWLVGFPGQLFGGFIALLVLISLVSGLMVYKPFVKRIAFGEIRRTKGRMTSQLDWHNFIGVVVMGWLLVVTLTGAFLSIGSIAVNVWRTTELKHMTAAYHGKPALANVVSIDTVIAAAKAAKPASRFTGAVFPLSEFSGSHHYGVFTSGKDAWGSKLLEITLVDAATGQVTHAPQTPWYLQTIMLSEPLHFGDYGGLPLQILWLLAAWLTLFITGNGAWLWWKKRRRGTA